MPRIHKIFAVLVFALAAAWVLTGEFSSVGSEIPGAETVAATEPAAEASVEVIAQEVPAPEVESLRKVRIALVPSTQYQRTIRISGSTEANKRVVLAALSNGMVRSMSVTEGDVVADGAVLLQLDIDGRDLALMTAEQLLTQRRADAAAYKRLLTTGDIPELQVNAAVTALRDAEGQVEMAKIELDRTRVSAPFAGVLDAVDAEVGTWVSQGTPVATLLQLDPVIAIVEINENSLGSVRVGDKAKITLATEEVVDGTIRFISRDASDQTRTYKVEVELPNPDNRIPSGMSAELEFMGPAETATILPRSVVLLNTEGLLGIRTVGPDNKVEFHEVSILDDTPAGLVLEGVPEGAKIIVLGQNFVQDGDVVDPVLTELAAAGTLK